MRPPVLSSRAHLGAHKRAAPFRSMFSCKGEEGNIGMLVWGGRGQGGRRGGGGGEGGGRGEGGRRILVFPSHRQPKFIGGGEASPPDLGAHLWVHTEGPPRPQW